MISNDQIAAFIILVLPGFISLRAYALWQPADEKALKDQIFEAICFGLVNAIMLWPYGVGLLLNTGSGGVSVLELWAEGIAVLLIFPILWAFILSWIVGHAQKRKWITHRARNAFVAFFTQERQCWVTVHMKNGDKITGWFGENSYASSLPEPGHLYLESILKMSDDGEINLERDFEPGKGILLTPEDYTIIEPFVPTVDETQNA